MKYGQLVVGPPGSGKTTYCRGLQEFLLGIGRKARVINLDPANDRLPYRCDVDVRDLIEAVEVQSEYELGPNGSMVFCMDYLLCNVDWLEERLAALPENAYLIIDCPGQVELFTLHASLKRIVEHLHRKLCYQLACVHLVDSHLCIDPAKYMSAALLSLNTMLHLALPHINVLSKVDLLPVQGELPFELECFVNGLDPEQLASMLSLDPFASRYDTLNRGLCAIIEDFGLVRFIALSVEDKELMGQLLQEIDRAVGYVACAPNGASIQQREEK